MPIRTAAFPTKPHNTLKENENAMSSLLAIGHDPQITSFLFFVAKLDKGKEKFLEYVKNTTVLRNSSLMLCTRLFVCLFVSLNEYI